MILPGFNLCFEFTAGWLTGSACSYKNPCHLFLSFCWSVRKLTERESADPGLHGKWRTCLGARETLTEPPEKTVGGTRVFFFRCRTTKWCLLIDWSTAVYACRSWWLNGVDWRRRWTSFATSPSSWSTAAVDMRRWLSYGWLHSTSAGRTSTPESRFPAASHLVIDLYQWNTAVKL